MTPTITTTDDVQTLSQQTLTDYTIIILNHDDLSLFVNSIGGADAVRDASDVTIFTEDEFTRNSVKFNLITFGAPDTTTSDTGYGIATQINDPINATDTVLDVRCTPTGFSDYLMGLL